MTQLRLGLALVGFILALAGVLLDDSRIVWAAIGALAGSFLVRLWIRHKRPEPHQE